MSTLWCILHMLVACTKSHSRTIFSLIFAIAQFKLYASSTINTNFTDQYKDANITCDDGEDCTVICDEHEACLASNIYCPSNYACNIQCIANRDTAATNHHNVCHSATFHCADSTQCDITCNNIGDYTLGWACYDATFNWPSNKQYTLDCGSGTSCGGVTIDPKYNDEPFSYNCNDIASCREVTFNCPTDSTCDITCDSSKEACKFFTLNCETTRTYPCTVYCGGYNGCHGGVINGIGTVTACLDVQSCERLIFPEPPSDVDYTLECVEASSCEAAVIKCPTDAECHISCTGSDSCADAQIIWPTNPVYAASLTCLDDNACLNVIRPDYTVDPTCHPTSDPTTNPTINHVSDPTTNPIIITLASVSTANAPIIPTPQVTEVPTYDVLLHSTKVFRFGTNTPETPKASNGISMKIFIFIIIVILGVLITLVCISIIWLFTRIKNHRISTKNKEQITAGYPEDDKGDVVQMSAADNVGRATNIKSVASQSITKNVDNHKAQESQSSVAGYDKRTVEGLKPNQLIDGVEHDIDVDCLVIGEEVNVIETSTPYQTKH